MENVHPVKTNKQKIKSKLSVYSIFTYEDLLIFEYISVVERVFPHKIEEEMRRK